MVSWLMLAQDNCKLTKLTILLPPAPALPVEITLLQKPTDCQQSEL